MSNNVGHIPDEVLDRQRQMWQDGKQPEVEEFLRDSDFHRDREALLDLLYNEIVVKEELCLNPSLEDYLQRYPELEADLKLHFEVHLALNQHLLLETASTHAEKTWPQHSATAPSVP